MRQLTFDEMEMVNGAENQVIADSYLSSIGFWGTYGASLGGALVPIFSYFEHPTLTTKVLHSMLAATGSSPLALNIFAGIGVGFTVGAVFGVGAYYLISKFELQD